MKTFSREEMRPASDTSRVTNTTRPVTVATMGISEVLSLRVGCWQAPLHLTVELPDVTSPVR
jgi:hypothetical protein